MPNGELPGSPTPAQVPVVAASGTNGGGGRRGSARRTLHGDGGRPHHHVAKSQVICDGGQMAASIGEAVVATAAVAPVELLVRGVAAQLEISEPSSGKKAVARRWCR